MSSLRTVQLGDEWKKRLGLSTRHSPDLYEAVDAVIDTPHAVAIRSALRELNVSAVFCVQGVPTVAIVRAKEYDREGVIELHGALWNQGLASLLLVIVGDTLRAFSLARKPYKDLGEEFERRCLVNALNAATDALKLGNLIYAAESGRFWKEHFEYFRPKERVDQVLLENLKASHQSLCNANLSSESAQALLMQAMFIAYLEDRKIITEDYFRSLSSAIGSFVALLETKKVNLLRSLFKSLRNHFNGDLFVAPCSFEAGEQAPTVTPAHLELLARFRSGKEEMGNSSQYRFWGYDFGYIPIELVSAVYDRFLGEQEEARREQGAYYTPMFLADTAMAQVWDLVPTPSKETGHFLDPACGSGVFLVRSFQRLCEHWRATHKQRTIRWPSLVSILRRVHGWDLNGSAVRVAVFSLYVALLEEVSPPDIRSLIERGKILPELWGKTLVKRDFFSAKEGDETFDAIIGNPPWTSRRGQNRSSAKWCERNNLPMPGGEDAWAFVWKALRHVTSSGVVAFLLPSMGFLHNHSANSVDARRRLFSESRVHRVVNFADLRFQLFDGAVRPAALFVMSSGHTQVIPYDFEYWAPKADLNLQIKRLITLSSIDKYLIDSESVGVDPLAFKTRLWMRGPDAKLFAYLSKLPPLGSFVTDFGSASRKREKQSRSWMIGQGFQPLNAHLDRTEARSFSKSAFVGKLPDVSIGDFKRLAQPTNHLKPWSSNKVRRKGFEEGFVGSRVLIPRGVETAQMRLRASFVESGCTFQHIIQAITIPVEEERRGKILTALLNSRVAIWFAFHGTASFGSDRPEVQQAELLRLPFPDCTDLPDPERARRASVGLIKVVDAALDRARGSFSLDSDESELLREIDALAYEYFCLSEDEKIVIEDAVHSIIPSAQPSQGSYPEIWKFPSSEERRSYALTLANSVNEWMEDGKRTSARLEAHNADLGILKLTLSEGNEEPEGYQEAPAESSLSEALSRLSLHIHQPLDGNFQLIPDFRIFLGKSLYLIKPMQKRFWLKSAALSDADSIATDLQDAAEAGRRGIA